MLQFRDAPMSSHFPTDSDSTLHLPRILCLHGGGTNARIFHHQTRALRRHLRPYFRLCFVDAPFLSSSPGPDVTSVYRSAHYGHYRRWFRFQESQPSTSTVSAVDAIHRTVEQAMAADDALGADGDWVGLLGFSQGAKAAASLLFRQQQLVQQAPRKSLLGRSNPRRHNHNHHHSSPKSPPHRFRFAILIAGRGPIVSLDPTGRIEPGAQDAAQLMEATAAFDEHYHRHYRQSHHNRPSASPPKLHLPTIHVHGTRDPGLRFHRQLRDRYCSGSSSGSGSDTSSGSESDGESESPARLIEWDGDHRVPIRKEDVWRIVRQVLDVARGVGVDVDEVVDV